MRVTGVSSISNQTNSDILGHARTDNVLDSIRQGSVTAQNNLQGKNKIDKKKDHIDTLISAVDDSNRALEGYNRRFEISVHEDTKVIMVKVIDTVTDELIREIPPEKILDMAAVLWEMAGILVDRKV